MSAHRSRGLAGEKKVPIASHAIGSDRPDKGFLCARANDVSRRSAGCVIQSAILIW